MTQPLAQLIAETASLLSDVDKAADHAKQPSNGAHWRQLAACRAEYERLIASAHLLDDVFQGRVSDPAEVERRYTAITKLNAEPEPQAAGSAPA